jgi:drug/metabolite transporter (DMT)-like permease
MDDLITLAIEYAGEAWALLHAVFLGLAVILYRKSGESVQPLGLNLFKNILAFILFVPTIYLFGESLFLPAPWQDYVLLIVSGALGIGLGDTLFFVSLNRLGAGRVAIVDCMYSPFTITLAFIFLGESLSIWQILGATMIIAAVLTGASERNGGSTDRRRVIWGFTWGIVAMACMASGIVMVKPILERSPLIWVTEVRLAGGIAVLLLALRLHPQRRTIVRSVLTVKGWVYTISGSFVGAYLAMILWLAGMKYAQASVAAALNQTSNIFIFVFAYLLLHERITLPRLIGITLAVGGVMLVTFG